MLGYFGSLQGGNVKKRVQFRGPPRAPRKRGTMGYTKGESPPQAEILTLQAIVPPLGFQNLGSKGGGQSQSYVLITSFLCLLRSFLRRIPSETFGLRCVCFLVKKLAFFPCFYQKNATLLPLKGSYIILLEFVYHRVDPIILPSTIRSAGPTRYASHWH